MVFLFKNIALRCGPGCFRGALAIAFVKIPYVPAPHFSWRASYSICQNPIRPCTTLVAWVGTPCSIQRGTLDSGHGRSIQRGVLDRWMHSRTVSVRKKWEKNSTQSPSSFQCTKFRNWNSWKPWLFNVSDLWWASLWLEVRPKDCSSKIGIHWKVKALKRFNLIFKKPGIDKRCIRWGLLVCLCSCLVYKYSEASTWKNPADTCCKVQRGQHLEESSGHLL